MNMYKYGAFNDTCQFAAKKPKSIIQFLQLTYPEKYGNYCTAKSFFYRTVKAAKAAAATPHLDPFRERRGENKKKNEA